ncbi:hypothetical protein DFH09DRAFT_1355471, partial [Mycena vulgaris]
MNQSQHRCMQDAVKARALRADYQAYLPTIPPSAYTRMEGSSTTGLQTVDDGLLFEFVTKLLITLPFGHDTRVMMRQVLTSNETCGYILANLEILDDPTVDDEAPGNVVKIYIEALERESEGSERGEVIEWVRRVWGPLALAGHAALLEFQQKKTGAKRAVQSRDEDPTLACSYSGRTLAEPSLEYLFHSQRYLLVPCTCSSFSIYRNQVNACSRSRCGFMK